MLTYADLMSMGRSDYASKPKKENKLPQEIVIDTHEMMKASFGESECSFDHYSRHLHAKIHQRTAQRNFFKNFGMIRESFRRQVTEQYYGWQENQPIF